MDSARVAALSRELRLVHQRLRDALQIARETLEDGTGEAEPDVGPQTDLLTYCWGFCTALNGHHSGEDTALFPLLVAANPELAPVVRALVQDHSMITHLVGDLRRSLERRSPVEDLLRHLDGIEAVMETHFRYEERSILPALDRLDPGGRHSTEFFGPLG